MSRKKPRRSVKVPRKVAIRRSAVREHRNRYASQSKQPHTVYGVLSNCKGSIEIKRAKGQ